MEYFLPHQEPRMSQSSAIAALQCELMNPKGTQEGKEYLPPHSHQATASPYKEPQGSAGCEKHRILIPYS